MMTLDIARTLVRGSVLHVQTGDYEDSKVDESIIWAGHKFQLATKSSRVTIVSSVGQGDNTADIAGDAGRAGLQPFHPAALLHARVGWKRLQLCDFDFIRHQYQACPNKSGCPRFMAFETTKGPGAFWPPADNTYDLTIAYWEPFTSFIPGTGTPTCVTFNIDDRWIMPVLTAAGAWMVRGEAGNPWTEKEIAYYINDFLPTTAGETNITAGLVIRYEDDERHNPAYGEL